MQVSCQWSMFLLVCTNEQSLSYSSFILYVRIRLTKHVNQVTCARLYNIWECQKRQENEKKELFIERLDAVVMQFYFGTNITSKPNVVLTRCCWCAFLSCWRRFACKSKPLGCFSRLLSLKLLNCFCPFLCKLHLLCADVDGSLTISFHVAVKCYSCIGKNYAKCDTCCGNACAKAYNSETGRWFWVAFGGNF